jgi:serine phosphatase RsbU (regulator of sigma subunit)
MEIRNKILIIEDERIIAQHIESYVELLGYEVVGNYSNAEEALIVLDNIKPDLILVDIMLAGEMSGIDFVNKIKETDEAVAIVYLTSSSDPKTLAEAKKSSPNGFVKKPFDEKQLEITIEFTLHKFKEDQNKGLKKDKKIKRGIAQIKDLNDTTQHLATATLRERELKNELQKTKELVEIQNKKIIDSINYAKRIQEAIIPKLVDIRKDFPITDWFYKPKDVVSGDFPYYYKKGDLIYYAAVDCTGHGVPGAMMSLIGHLVLNEVLGHTEIYTPGEALLRLHNGVVKTLKQDHPDNKAADGMDVGICCYNTKTKKLQYSGAHRPLYLVREGEEVIQYKGGKYPIGGNQYGGKNTFPNYEVDIESGDKIYFFSDGYPDQFGGPDDLKIGPKRIRKMLASNSDKSLTENISILTTTFEEWMGDGKQMDDVLMIGIQF